jgi:hypothetical protein
MRHCTISVWSSMNLAHLFAINEPHELSCRFGTPWCTVDTHSVPNLVAGPPAGDLRPFFRQRCNTTTISNNDQYSIYLYSVSNIWRHSLVYTFKHYGSVSSQHGASAGRGWRRRLPDMENTADILNKQSRRADKGWSSRFGVGRGANNSSP